MVKQLLHFLLANERLPIGQGESEWGETPAEGVLMLQPRWVRIWQQQRSNGRLRRRRQLLRRRQRRMRRRQRRGDGDCFDVLRGLERCAILDWGLEPEPVGEKRRPVLVKFTVIFWTAPLL